MRISRPTEFLPQVKRGKAIEVQINGRQVTAFEGETVAAVLLSEDQRVLGHRFKTGRPRGFYCGMGVCYECLVTVDGLPNVRACLTPLVAGMVIETRSKMNL